MGTPTKHTPGPWELNSIGPDEDKDICFVVWPHLDSIKSRHNRIADVKGTANAHLIAAAPELLAALKRLVSSPHGEMAAGDITIAETAIAKAEGRS